MGKNKKSNIEYDGIEFDSNEELEFYHWCIEAKKYKITPNIPLVKIP